MHEDILRCRQQCQVRGSACTRLLAWKLSALTGRSRHGTNCTQQLSWAATLQAMQTGSRCERCAGSSGACWQGQARIRMLNVGGYEIHAGLQRLQNFSKT